MSRNNTWDKTLSPEAVQNTLHLSAEAMGVDVDTFGIVDITGYTASDLASDLTKVIIEQRLFKPKYKYVLISMYGMRPVENGATWYDYSDYTDGDNRGAQDDNTTADFNAEYEPMLREAFKVAEKIHKKNKLPALVLSDAWATAEGITGFVLHQREANVRALSKAIEIKGWVAMVDGAEFVDVVVADGETEDQAIARAMFEDLETYGTTSIEHKGIGVNGVITVETVNGPQTIQPEEYFDSVEFDLITRPNYKTGITFDSDAVFFNWNATNKQLNSQKTLEFSKYTGMSPEIKTVLENAKVILNHKEKLDMLEFFNYQSTVKGASAFEVIHNFSEYDVYTRKDRPTLIYQIVPAPLSEAKKQARDAKIEKLIASAKLAIRKGTANVSAIQEANGDTSVVSESENIVNKYDAMTIKELTTIATKKGIVIPKGMKKAEIILELTK